MLKLISKLFGGGGQRVETGPQSSPATITNGPVGFDAAMQVSAVWSCVRLLSETVGSLPIRVRTKDGELDTESDIAQLLNGGLVNRYQTRPEFLEAIMLALTLRGNAYALKQRSGERLIGLLPLAPDQVQPELLSSGSLVYHLSDANGTIKTYPADQIWHLKLFGSSVMGLSPLQYAANGIRLARAAEQRQQRVFARGGKLSGVLSTKQVLTEPQRDAYRKSLKAVYADDGDHVAVLPGDVKFEKMSLTSEDAELLKTRQYSVEDIARAFGVPSVLINSHNTTTWGSGISEIVRGWHKLGLAPYLKKIEHSIEAHLLTPAQRQQLSIHFDMDGLLRADQETRYEGFQKAINSALLSPNEARALEGLAPLPGGDLLIANGNLRPLSQLNEQE